jgi:hypothetical protein
MLYSLRSYYCAALLRTESTPCSVQYLRLHMYTYTVALPDLTERHNMVIVHFNYFWNFRVFSG